MNIPSLQELNLEFQLETRQEPSQPAETKADLMEIFEEAEVIKPSKLKKRHKSAIEIISDILFFSAILGIILAIFTFGLKNDGSPRPLMGYSSFTVLTASMQEELPKGSFILVKHTEPDELEIGDNITFTRDASTTVSHKIIGIYENYENSGTRGFQTKGVNNSNPDKDIVFGDSVIGKVVFVLPNAGFVLSYLSENIYVIYIIFGLLVILSILIRGILIKSAENN